MIDLIRIWFEACFGGSFFAVVDLNLCFEVSFSQYTLVSLYFQGFKVFVDAKKPLSTVFH